MTDFLSDEYWNNRYAEGRTGWDLGNVSPPIRAYIDQLDNKDLRILIPGAGPAHEASYLYSLGYKNVHVLDFAPLAIQSFLQKNPGFPPSQAHAMDYFEFSDDSFDLIFEQTMFCALDPSLRKEYAEKSSSLLNDGGKLVGVMFSQEFDGGPPFGGTKAEYVELFKPHYSSILMENCYNSIEPRQGNELFIRITK